MLLLESMLAIFLRISLASSDQVEYIFDSNWQTIISLGIFVGVMARLCPIDDWPCRRCFD